MRVHQMGPLFGSKAVPENLSSILAVGVEIVTPATSIVEKGEGERSEASKSPERIESVEGKQAGASRQSQTSKTRSERHCTMIARPFASNPSLAHPGYTPNEAVTHPSKLYPICPIKPIKPIKLQSPQRITLTPAPRLLAVRSFSYREAGRVTVRSSVNTITTIHTHAQRRSRSLH